MKRLAHYLLPAFLILTASFNAIATTPIEAFIARMKETSHFAPVSDIWQPDNNYDYTKMVKYVEQGQALTISYDNLATFMKQKNTSFNLILPDGSGSTYTVELARYDYFSNDFEVHTKGANGEDKRVNYTPGLYYSGIVKGYPGSVASFSFFRNEVYGIFSIPDVGNFVLAPNTLEGNSYDYNPSYVLYNDALLKIKHQAPGCATDQLPELFGDENNFAAHKTTTFLNNKVYNNCTYLRVYEVVDYDMYTQKGSNVTTATNYVTALFNNQATIYRNEGVPIVLKHLQINTATDEYMSITSAQSVRFLRKFGWVTKNVMHGCDVALLLSTRFGTLGGIAWVKAICKSYSNSDSSGSYGFANVNNVGITNFPTYSWNVEVLSHEMGHMLGSPHTHRCCWNPPARNTAIDGCNTIEGSCPVPSPALPAGGGTIMSYCHLTSANINFSKGFGPQPGDTIRRFIRQRLGTTSTAFPTCGEKYKPNVTLPVSNRRIVANRECTDISGSDTTTYFWYDKNTAAYEDDTLVMVMKKNSNFIGTLDSAGFSVETGTSPLYGSGRADTMAFPPGTATASPIGLAMRRYWKITATAVPASPVTLMLPFTAQDTTDIDGSVPGPTNVNNLKLYWVNNPTNPSPYTDSVYFTSAANVKVYTKAATPSASEWSLTNDGSTLFATINTTNLKAGGSAFYNSTLVSVKDINSIAGNIRIFPNPTRSAWYISMEDAGNNPMDMYIYSADGRQVLQQMLTPATTSMIDATKLPAGIYYYRIIDGNEVLTGTLSRE